MKRNIGTVDRVIRTVVGIGLVALAVTGVSAWGWLGLVLLGTAVVGFCPPYALLGISTCGTSSTEPKKSA